MHAGGTMRRAWRSAETHNTPGEPCPGRARTWIMEGGQAEPPTQTTRRCVSRRPVASRCCSKPRHTVGTACARKATCPNLSVSLLCASSVAEHGEQDLHIFCATHNA